MAEQMTPVEALVRERDEAQQTARLIDAAMCQMRLGRKVGESRRGVLTWLKGGYAGGWSGSDRDEPIPLGPGIAQEFYEFLAQRRSAEQQRVKDMNARLALIEVDRG